MVLSMGRATARVSLSAACSCSVMLGSRTSVCLACVNKTPSFGESNDCPLGENTLPARPTPLPLPAAWQGAEPQEPGASPAQAAALVALPAAPAHRGRPLGEPQDRPEHQALHAQARAPQVAGKEAHDAVQLVAELCALQQLKRTWGAVPAQQQECQGRNARARPSLAPRQQGLCRAPRGLAAPAAPAHLAEDDHGHRLPGGGLRAEQLNQLVDDGGAQAPGQLLHFPGRENGKQAPSAPSRAGPALLALQRSLLPPAQRPRAPMLWQHFLREAPVTSRAGMVPTRGSHLATTCTPQRWLSALRSAAQPPCASMASTGLPRPTLRSSAFRACTVDLQAEKGPGHAGSPSPGLL